MGLFFGDGAPSVLPRTVVPKVGAALGATLGEGLGAEEMVGATLGASLGDGLGAEETVGAGEVVGAGLGAEEMVGAGEVVGAGLGMEKNPSRSRSPALSNPKTNPNSSSSEGRVPLLLSPERSLGSLRRRETAPAASTCPGSASPLFRCARMTLVRSALLSSAFTAFSSYESTCSNFTTTRSLRLGR
jgi:hypothetical protein